MFTGNDALVFTTNDRQHTGQISEMEQKVADLTGQLDERTGELQAARAAERKIMTRTTPRVRLQDQCLPG